LGGYGDQDVLEVRKVKSFERLGRSEFIQLHADCVSYHSGDYRAESLVHTFTVVLHVVHTHIKYILLCCSSCENPRQKPIWDTNTATMISSDRDDENWED
jgi:hypothetical protein